MEALIDTVLVEHGKTTKYNLGVFLNDHGLSSETTVFKHIKDLAEGGGLYFVGGAARKLFNWKVRSLTPSDDLFRRFREEVKPKIKGLESDWDKALEIGREISKYALDVDLIVQSVGSSYFNWKLLTHKETGLDVQVEKDPHRYSIRYSHQDLNYKIDITDKNGNARLGKYATTLDSMILPVDTNLDLYGTSIYQNTPPVLGMLGDTTGIQANFKDKMSQIIAVRFLTQMLTVYMDKTGQETSVPVYYGKDIQELESTHKWLKNSLACVIRDRGDTPNTYHKLLYTVIPNWQLFSPEIQEIIKKSFVQGTESN